MKALPVKRIILVGLIAIAVAAVWYHRPFEPTRAIVLITVDSLRPDRLSCYGYGEHATPNIDRLARSGIVFTNAHSTSGWTVPAIGAILSGMYPSQLGLVEIPVDPTLDWTARRPQLAAMLPDGAETIAEVLGEAGYRTAAFVNQPELARGDGFVQGFDEWHFPLAGRKLRRHDPNTILSAFPGSFTWQNQAHLDRELIGRLRDWLEGHARGRTFVWLHLLSPHPPHNPPREHRRGGERSASALYDAEIRYTDDMVGHALRAIETALGLENVTIVFVSDHGISLDEDETGGLGSDLLRENLWVPIIVSGPGVTPGEVDRPVTTADVAGTLLDLAGATSKRRGLLARADDAGVVYAEGVLYGTTKRALIRGDHKLIVDERGPRYRLFDLRSDPGERHNLAGDRPDELARYVAVLDSIRSALSPPEHGASDDAVNVDVPRLSIEGDNVLVIRFPKWPGSTWRYRLPEYVRSMERPESVVRADAATGKRDGAVTLSGRIYDAGENAHGEYRIVATPVAGGVDFEMRLENTGRDSWTPDATLCLQSISAFDFNDPKGERTRLITNGGLRSVVQLQGAAAGAAPAHRAHLIDSADSVRVRDDARGYFLGSAIASLPTIVRSAKDEKRHIALSWEHAWKVSYNLEPSFDCIHSEPRFDTIDPGGSRTARGKILFLEGAPDAAIAVTK